MQKGKIDPTRENLRRHYHKIVHQFSPVLMPYTYLQSASIPTASVTIAAVLHSYIVEFPDQLKTGLADDRSTSTRMHLLKMLFNIQEKEPNNVKKLFLEDKTPFVFQLNLLERWALHAFFDRKNIWSFEQFEFVTDISHAQAQATYWSVITHAKRFFMSSDSYPDCRSWPMILSNIGDEDRIIPEMQQKHLASCHACQQAKVQHLELLKLLSRQIPRPAFTSEIQQQILQLILSSGMPKQEQWYKKCWKKMHDWGILSEPAN